jgi:hypothetical protein
VVTGPTGAEGVHGKIFWSGKPEVLANITISISPDGFSSNAGVQQCDAAWFCEETNTPPRDPYPGGHPPGYPPGVGVTVTFDVKDSSGATLFHEKDFVTT